MKAFPEVPTADAADPSVFETGHLWLLEHVAGEPLRFQLQPSGVIQFGDRQRTYSDGEDLAPRYTHAVRHIQHRLDREALRDALPDPTDVTFFGSATQDQGIPYDWHALPSFLGVYVWTASRESFVPPDVSHKMFEGIGLAPITPIEREVHARDFDIDSYELPTSCWADQPAAGVLIRNKRGGQALLESNREPGSPDLPDAVDGLVDELVTPDSIEGAVATLHERGQAVTVDALVEECMILAWRVYHHAFTGGRHSLDPKSVRSNLARYLAQHADEITD